MSSDDAPTKEIAKTAGKAIDLARELGGFFSTVFGEGFRHLGDAFADWAAFYRYRNLVSIEEKWREVRRRRGIEAATLPLPSRLAIPILEHASREDDPSLQAMWAALLANSGDPERRLKVRKIFVEVLGSFENNSMQTN